MAPRDSGKEPAHARQTRRRRRRTVRWPLGRRNRIRDREELGIVSEQRHHLRIEGRLSLRFQVRFLGLRVRDGAPRGRAGSAS